MFYGVGDHMCLLKTSICIHFHYLFSQSIKTIMRTDPIPIMINNVRAAKSVKKFICVGMNIHICNCNVHIENKYILATGNGGTKV